MSTAAGRVFTGLTRAVFSREIFTHNATPTVSRLSSVRPLALSSQRSAKSKNGDKEVNNEPIKFSTSKASHRTWKVDRSMGSQFERPWRKILPISLVFTSFLLWCALRGETDVDAQLQKPLFERFSELLSEEEEKKVQNKSS